MDKRRREITGSFYTPQIWVELSQKYLADVLGENWQDEYYVWDCAAGTGNLLTGLTNKYNIWASTLDKQDVDVMHDRISNGANLLEGHVFQFDFLNDDFSKLPKSLQDIINNPKKRKKLIIYINPPYAEAASKKTLSGINSNRIDISVKTKIYSKYFKKFGISGRELFAQFFMRIFNEIKGCYIAEFSTLKIILSPSFAEFREVFYSKLEKMFVVPSFTFDNVNGKFPIGFFIWNTNKQEKFKKFLSDVYNEEGNKIENKLFINYDEINSINEWLINSRKRSNEKNIAFMSCKGNDFQTISLNFIVNDKTQLPHARGTWVTNKTLVECSIYYATRHCIRVTWLNNRDQFLYPNDGWEKDIEFQNDCLTFTLFSNNIQSKFGTNHWIPFTEHEVNSREKFESNFMSKFISGTCKAETNGNLLDSPSHQKTPLVFSQEAKTVFDAGRELWKYYHKQPNCNVNASLYDIREHFQKRNEAGKMNNKSDDETYTKLIGELRETLKRLSKKIEPKVYEYGFLKE